MPASGVTARGPAHEMPLHAEQAASNVRASSRRRSVSGSVSSGVEIHEIDADSVIGHDRVADMHQRLWFLPDQDFENSCQVTSPLASQVPRIFNNTYAAVDSNRELIDAIKCTLDTVRNVWRSADTSCVRNRMKFLKKLPSFSGEPREFPIFKRAVNLLFEIEDIGASEVTLALYQSLSGKARKAAKDLFIAGDSARQIMETLEVRFGNTQVVGEKISQDLKNLPSSTSGNIELFEFASSVKNAVVAMKSLSFNDCLQSKEIVQVILNKLPSVMIFNYSSYAAGVSESKFALEKLADYLCVESEKAMKAGLSKISSFVTEKCSNDSVKNSRSKSNAVFAVRVADSAKDVDREKRSNYECAFCKLRNHSIASCGKFESQQMRMKWKIVKKLNLCFLCLRLGHLRDGCTGVRCDQCNKPHHRLLHFSSQEGEASGKVNQAQSSSGTAFSTDPSA
ncbi:hypothetical protein TKK_0002994 [Trichogramma kaykai]|uniref:VWFA domain-containing protein n=1 Tax=Trichogramma kaykai TaxID=54128 RepID=A0ABD2XQH2_9HYME